MLSHYFLGVLHKYIETTEEKKGFQFHMNKALELDPNFLEAQIALRDGLNYLDPFFFPKWEDLCDGKAEFRPAVLRNQSKAIRTDLVRYNWSIIPAIIIKYPRTSFRTSLADNPEANVLINLEAVQPAFPALVHIVPVIFDDPDDPFYCSTYLNVFPIAPILEQNINLLIPADYQPFLGRDTARRFCHEPYQCALFVLDMQNCLLMARIIDFSASEVDHFQEMDQVLELLDDRKLDFLRCKQAAELHDTVFVRKIRNPQGKLITIPAGRDPEIGEKVIFPVTRRGDRLMLKGMEKFSDVSQFSRSHDIFISHAHADSIWVTKIRNWLESIWPSLKIFRTEPKNAAQEISEPFFFLEEIHRSRCLIFLASPRSIQRPMVDSELGAAIAKPIISVLVGGATLKQLKKHRNQDLFSGIDLNRVVTLDTQAGWKRFARLIAAELNLSLPDSVPSVPNLDPTEIIESTLQDPLKSFFEQYLKRITLTITGKQTESEAERLLDLVETEFIKRQNIDLEMYRAIPVSPRGRLISIMSCIPDENVIVQFLKAFPALVDDNLIFQLRLMIKQARNQDVELFKRFENLLKIILKHYHSILK
ncbi:MAG: toll/interleukin-1 receptor domain-containing protein [Promethearchaeota archaeon]